MKLRTKLLVGYAGFVLALGVLGAWSARTLSQMSRVSGRIISENYDSVVAAQDMKESLERQDSAALFDLLGQRDRARRQIAEHRARFDAALAKAAANITEIGEADMIDAIRRGRDEYLPPFRRVFDRVGRSNGAVLRTARTAVQRGPGSGGRAAAPEPGGDAPQGRRRLADRAPLVFHDAGARRPAHGRRNRRRNRPLQRDHRPGPAAHRGDDPNRRRRSRRCRPRPIRRRDRHAGGRVQPDGGAHPRTEAIRSGKAAGGAADHRSRHRFPLRSGGRHRQRPARDPHQRRRRTAVRRPRRASSAIRSTRSPRTRGWRRP